MKPLTFSISTITLALLPSYLLHAQTVDEVMVVVGNRSAAAISNVSGSVTAISSQEMARNMANNVQDAVKAEPGVEIAGTGKFGLSSFNIRGMNEDRVKLLIDGIEQPVFFKAGSGSPHTDVINQYSAGFELDTLTAIEINKNAASSLYGSDAIGGAVLLRTKTPDDVLQGEARALNLSLGYTGANQGVKNTLEAAVDNGNWQGLAIYTFRDEAETQAHGEGADIIGVMRGLADPANYRSHNLLLKGVSQLTGSQTLALTAELYLRDGDSDLWSMEGYTVAGRGNQPDTLYFNNRLESEQSRWRLTMAHQWDANKHLFDSWQWHLSWQQADTDNDNYRTKNTDCLAGCVLIRNREDKHLQLHGQFDKQVSLNSAEQYWIYGVSVVHSEFDSFYQDLDSETGVVTDTNTTMPAAKALRSGLFIKQQLTANAFPLQWDLGLRYDDYRTDPDGDLARHESNVLTFNTGLLYRLTDELGSYITVTSGYRAPSLYDLYYRLDLPHVTILPNESLEAERSTNYEWGIRWNSKNTQLEAALYYNDYRDFIDSVVDDTVWPNVMQYQNVGEAWIRGAELKAHWQLSDWLDGASLRMSAAWSEGKNRLTQRALDTIAPFNSTLDLSYDHPDGHWGASWFIKYSAAKQGDDWTELNNLTAPEYLYMDLLAYWQVTDELKLQVGIMNLTDERYWLYGNLAGLQADPQMNPDRLTQPGRHINATLHYRF
ncbi:TonB-dependent hemoglobin/transferrin/lactoferrin family receptor [Shewanella carassii]|uniref:Ligand-gated channel n=1 Tax=Shewanella carassii TaxID=1987584 RepID=A0ABQ1T3P8_9GAMM|nr:TonB-dependent hemoglobin/transferrin/lactoferrin family receptor [Shewanella carassii]GGE80008.1 ligand-gated channel [Shewanella carassii]